MTSSAFTVFRGLRTAIVITTLIALLTACATTPSAEGREALNNLRNDLATLRADDGLTDRVPLALAEAERAVRAAGADGLDSDERRHRILLAEKRIEIARAADARARAQHDLDQVAEARTRLLLNASRIEVRQAREEAEQARRVSVATQEEIERARLATMTAEELRDQASRRELEAREEAEAARRLTEAQASEIELARREAELASEAAASLQRRLELMELRQTDRGTVITLGDVLFASGQTTLEPDARARLDDVVELLASEPDKRVRIEGHTDATGGAQLNLRISQQRADAVMAALVELGISADRIQSLGMGQAFPIASNDSAEGRSRNRRVDVILLDE